MLKIGRSILEDGTAIQLMEEKLVAIKNLDDLLASLREKVVTASNGVADYLQKYQENYLDREIEQISQKSDLPDNQKNEMIKEILDLKDLVLKPFLDRGAVVLSTSYVEARTILAQIPGIQVKDLQTLIDYCKLIYVSTIDGSINTMPISVPVWYTLLDWAVNNNPQAPLNVRKLLRAHKTSKLGKVQNSIFFKNFQKQGFQFVSRQQMNEIKSSQPFINQSPLDKDNDEGQNDRIQSVLLVKFNYDYTPVDSHKKSNVKEINPYRSFVRFTILLLDTQTDELLSADNFLVSKDTAQTFMSYIEYLHPEFKAQEIHSNCQQILIDMEKSDLENFENQLLNEKGENKNG